ncbi:MAG: c-type cytochrome [Rivularia sp. (in: cyanobacteria)]
MYRFFRHTILVMIVVTLIFYFSELPGKTQENNPLQIVPGPWGEIVDPVAPQKFESDVEKVIFYRQQQMRALSAHFRSLEGIIDYDVPFKGQAIQHVEALNDIAKYLPDLFPEGTAANPDKKGAKDLIWKEPEKFSQHIQGFQKSLADLQCVLNQSGESNNKKTALIAVRHQCLACHASYRVR